MSETKWLSAADYYDPDSIPFVKAMREAAEKREKERKERKEKAELLKTLRLLQRQKAAMDIFEMEMNEGDEVMRTLYLTIKLFNFSFDSHSISATSRNFSHHSL